MNIKKRVQTKFNQVTAKYQSYFSRPIYKFIRDISFGILRSGHVHLSEIGAALEEETSLKKTTERLSSHLGRVGLDKELTHCHLEVTKPLCTGSAEVYRGLKVPYSSLKLLLSLGDVL